MVIIYVEQMTKDLDVSDVYVEVNLRPSNNAKQNIV